jgi:ATP-dependent Clp protease ATP-binding subunit ClpB
MIIFLDFDGTIVEHAYPNIGESVDGCFEVIAKLQKAGHKIILNSYRIQSKSGKLKIALDHINLNGVGIIEPIYEFSKSKINPFYWNWDVFRAVSFIFLDDECLGVPLRKGAVNPNRMVLDWEAVDKQFEANGLYSTYALIYSDSIAAIGANTYGENQNYIENDEDSKRRQKEKVEEPSEQDAIAILRGLKEHYETHHKVQIENEALINAVELSSLNISNRFLPNKAINLHDEAASKLRIEIDSLPKELDELNHRIMQLEIEKEVVKKENDKDKLSKLNSELANLNEERSTINARWRRVKDVLEKIQTRKGDIEQYKNEADQAERNGDFGKAGELRYGRIKEAEEEVSKLQMKLIEVQGDKPLVKEKVDVEDIADVVSKWTGIPVNRMLQSERQKLVHLEAELHKRVVGQEEAVAAISDAVRRSRAGLQDPKKPIGSFIFLGTTGVGKTELAKALAAFLFNDDNAMVRIDMSEYQEKHTVSRLIGAPPGYVGYDKGGQLTDAVRIKPYSVILLDDIEKAHPDVFNILLQVLDDGRLTDNKGRTSDFKNTIVIMTSNIGSQIIQENFEGFTDANKDEVLAKTKNEVYQLLKSTIRPEFLNRIDEILMFEPLSRENIQQIVTIQLAGITKQLAEAGFAIEITEEATDWLGQLGYDPQFGARPLKRVLQKKVLNELSKKILNGEIKKDSTIIVDAFNNEIVFRN